MRKTVNFGVVAAFVATLSVVRMSPADTAWKWREGIGTSITNATGTWTMKEGAPYLFRTSAVRHALPVDTLVTGDGIPPGAFLKRVFTGTSIEISAPAEATFQALTNAVDGRYAGRPVRAFCAPLRSKTTEENSRRIGTVPMKLCYNVRSLFRFHVES